MSENVRDEVLPYAVFEAIRELASTLAPNPLDGLQRHSIRAVMEVLCTQVIAAAKGTGDE